MHDFGEPVTNGDSELNAQWMETPAKRTQLPSTAVKRAARGLGWFSLGLGLAEVAAPDQLAGLIGVRRCASNRQMIRAMGLREIANGLGILARPRSSRLVGLRVIGDLVDLALLRSASTTRGSRPARLKGAIAAVAGITALDALVTRYLRRAGRAGRGQPAQEASDDWVYVARTITVNRPVSEVYRFWRSFENLPRFTRNLKKVEVLGDRRSRWQATGPAGTTVAWEAEITEDRPDQRIAWRSLKDASVANAGAVNFTAAPGGRGTEIHVTLEYDPPGGRVGSTVAKAIGKEPGQLVMMDLRRLKQVLEVGEVIQSNAPGGAR
jgi:uncharacterized membrane protein